MCVNKIQLGFIGLTGIFKCSTLSYLWIVCSTYEKDWGEVTLNL